MSITYTIDVFCDHCSDWVNGVVRDWPIRNAAADARKIARGWGWHRTRDNRDICPPCWAEGMR